MRILVLSDSHGRAGSVCRAIENHAEAEAVVFLGDGVADFETAQFLLGGKRTICLTGNCDFYSDRPLRALEIFEGRRAYCTHGHIENVKFGLGGLLTTARAHRADIVLYGHTHIPVSLFEDGMHIFNPGSVRDGNYGAVDVTPAGIVTLNLRL